MAVINDLIARIQDPELRQRIEEEVKDLTKQKKFGLVFEKHVPEMTLLYDYPISRGCRVIRKVDDDKILTEDILWEVKKVSKGIATCQHIVSREEVQFGISDIICVVKNGEPIYPCLKYIDSIQNAPDSNLWHALIEADNYHALQLLAYLYPGQVDCIYIDPPYNSGAKDWKYNNDYVDSSDYYRHSKWLSMMEVRLNLARKLLNPKDSVLIVAIDEKEYTRLGCLLEELFPEARIQMVSTVINPSGVSRGKEFYRTDEYLYILKFGESAPSSLRLGSEWLTAKSTGKDSVRWRPVRRQGSHDTREDAINQFYPIFISKDGTHFIDAGDTLSADMHPQDYQENEDYITLWPIKPNGVEGCWQISQDSLRTLKAAGYLKVTYSQRWGYTIKYLAEGERKKVEDGLFSTFGKNEYGTLIIADANEDVPFVPGTQWRISSHSSREHGSTLLNKIIGNRFSFPKSLYAVHDAIRFFVANKPNALIIDFFAGSGTTLHAVNLLNKEDGGNRRCIMVTNNEISAEEEESFKRNGFHRGDVEWEKYGIARYVNWPRTKCSIEGNDVNGQPIKGDYFTSNSKEITERISIKQLSFDIPDGPLGIKIKKQIVALINDKNIPQKAATAESPFIIKENASTAILFDINSIDNFIEEIHDDIETIYVITSNNSSFKTIKSKLKELPEKIKTAPVTFPMSEGFAANAAFYKLTFLDKESISIGAQLDSLLPILWMKAGAHGVCPTHAEYEYTVYPENKMAILLDEYAFDDLKSELLLHPNIETVYIIDDSEENYRYLASQLKVKNTYQLYRDYLDNFKINIERR